MTNVTQIMSEYKFIKDYAKWKDDVNRYEVWEEAVDRVMDMHKIKYKDKLGSSKELQELVEYATQAYKDKFCLASQRSLQFGGEPTLKKNQRMYNCLVSYCNRVRFFQEAMHWLLCGGGVGFSVQKHHVSKLPKLQQRTKGVKTFIIEDSIEGWSDAFGVLISSFCENDSSFPDYEGYRIDFDYSFIRPEGSLISGGFKAPGPEGLRQSIIKVEQLLNAVRDRRLKPIEAYDVVMHMSDAVLSGGRINVH